jgi:hypothetical protein
VLAARIRSLYSMQFMHLYILSIAWVIGRNQALVATVPYLKCKQTFQCEMANTNVAVQNVDSFHRPHVGYLVKGKTT